MRAAAHLGFRVTAREIRNDILVPRYYDPEIDELLEEMGATHELRSIDELIEAKQLDLRQGNYVPKLHYGTGRIPYVRSQVGFSGVTGRARR